MFFDTHAHLTDKQFKDDFDEVIRSIKAANVTLVLNPGSSLSNSYRSAELSEELDFVYSAVGVHPHSVKDLTEEGIGELFALSKKEKVMAIGEIGLDYFYDYSPREIQKTWFRRQLELAREVNLPAIIHCRDAYQDTLEIISDFPDVPMVFHCYSGSLEFAKILEKKGIYLSFTGTITYKNEKKSPDIIQFFPIDRIMIETDAPYLSPTPFRGERNDPSKVPFVAMKIADIKNMSTAEIGNITMENGKRFFHI